MIRMCRPRCSRPSCSRRPAPAAGRARRLASGSTPLLDPGHRLTLVSAPAGFGKTTLLGDWLAHLGQRPANTRVAWLSLDDGDNDLTRLVAHLVAALQGVGLDIDAAVLESVRTASAAAALTALVNDIARAGEQAPGTQWLLVLDDYHAIEAPEVHEAVTFLLDHLPDHAAPGDRDPLRSAAAAGPAAQPRAAHRGARRRPPVHPRRGAGVPQPGDGAGPHRRRRRTRSRTAPRAGSPACSSPRSPCAASPSRARSPASSRRSPGATGSSSTTWPTRCWPGNPREVRDFLLRTAVLDRLTGPLCDAVTGRADGTRMLEDLERGNLFLVPLDTERSWYRYHHLFADVLRARLLAEQPEQVPALHQRASAWYAAHDLVADAVRHALAAEDFDRAAHLVEEALPELRRDPAGRPAAGLGAVPAGAGGAPKPGPQHPVRLVADDVR